MAKVFTLMYMIGIILFLVLNIAFAIIGKRPRGKVWKYILISVGAIIICGLVGRSIALI